MARPDSGPGASKRRRNRSTNKEAQQEESRAETLELAAKKAKEKAEKKAKEAAQKAAAEKMFQNLDTKKSSEEQRKLDKAKREEEVRAMIMNDLRKKASAPAAKAPATA